jgi:hypothetical protein
MKSRLLLIPLVLSAATAMADSDAHAQAAALLSRPQTPVVFGSEGQGGSQSRTATIDAHARAAALLSGVRTGDEVSVFVRVDQGSSRRATRDAHAQAAALLSPSFDSADSPRPTRQARGEVYTRGWDF